MNKGDEMTTVQLTPDEFTELYDVLDIVLDLLEDDDERTDIIQTIQNKLQNS